jgi:pseudouridylate synthase
MKPLTLQYFNNFLKMQIFKIEENDANQRLDKFLKKLFPNATRSLIYKLNRKDKIKVKNISDGEKFRKKDNEYKLEV